MSSMANNRSTTDFYNIVGVTTTSSIKEICKAYKSLMKWSDHKHHHHHHHDKSVDLKEAYDKVISRFDQEPPLNISEPTTTSTTTTRTKGLGGFDHHKSIDDSFFSRRSSIFSRNTSRRRSKTPTPTSVSASLSRNCSSSRGHRSFSSDRENDSDDHSSRGGSLRGRRAPPPPDMETETVTHHIRGGGGGSNRGRRQRAAAAAIVFSQTTAKKKPPSVERRLECTLEELLEGCIKKIKITRDVISDSGIIVQEEELLRVNVKPGWRKGTKITLEGRGDEKPGYLPADIVLSIDEIRHPLYERDGDDLEIVVEIPLVNALTGCSIPIPLLGGDKMTLSFDDIIFPGYMKVIRGQGMPKVKEPERRGDLRIKFLVEFPVFLRAQQRAEAVEILGNS